MSEDSIVDESTEVCRPNRFYWESSQEHCHLPNTEIHVFSCALEVAPSNLVNLTRFPSSDELERAQRFRFKRDRMHFIVARAELRMILSRYLDIKPNAVQFSYGAHGKPTLTNHVCGDGIRFNISRSHEIGIVAIQLGGEIGVDVEFINPFPDAMRIAFVTDSSQQLRIRY